MASNSTSKARTTKMTATRLFIEQILPPRFKPPDDKGASTPPHPGAKLSVLPSLDSMLSGSRVSRLWPSTIAHCDQPATTAVFVQNLIRARGDNAPTSSARTNIGVFDALCKPDEVPQPARRLTSRRLRSTAEANLWR